MMRVCYESSMGSVGPAGLVRGGRRALNAQLASFVRDWPTGPGDGVPTSLTIRAATHTGYRRCSGGCSATRVQFRLVCGSLGGPACLNPYLGEVSQAKIATTVWEV